MFLCFQSSILKAQCVRLKSSSKADEETDGHKEEQRETGGDKVSYALEFRERRQALIPKEKIKKIKKALHNKKAKPASSDNHTLSTGTA